MTNMNSENTNGKAPKYLAHDVEAVVRWRPHLHLWILLDIPRQRPVNQNVYKLDSSQAIIWAYHTADPTSDCHAPEHALSATMGALCDRCDCCTDNDEEGRKHECRFASDTVAYKANQYLAHDFPLRIFMFIKRGKSRRMGNRSGSTKRLKPHPLEARLRHELRRLVYTLRDKASDIQPTTSAHRSARVCQDLLVICTDGSSHGESGHTLIVVMIPP